MFNSRQKNILLNLIASPFFLAMPFALGIIWFLPNPASKFKAELVREEMTDKPNAIIQFCDLDGDGIDEQVLAFHNMVKNEAAIKVMTSDGFTYDQWNFNGYFQNQQEFLSCTDLDEDGYKEIYVFYYKGDSVFMGCAQPFPRKKMFFSKKWIANVKKRDGKIDYSIHDIKAVDMDRDGTKELIFILDAGFSRQPRGVFVFNKQADSSEDGFREVFYNANGEEYTSSNFNFQPDTWKQLSFINVPFHLTGKSYMLLGILEGDFVVADQNFNLIKIKSSLFDVSFQFKADLNKDGKEEFVFYETDGERVVITDPNLDNPLWVPTHLKAETRTPLVCGIKHNGSMPDELYFQAYERLYFYTYQTDPLYYLKYPLWLLIYGVVVLVLWATQRLQAIQTQRRQKMEDTINSLQMRTIKSQMDPHFMFNVLNGLANNVALGNSTEAYDQIIRFSKLLRSMMSRGERIDISLNEELDFVRNYLELEKFRFKEDFDFSLELDNSVDPSIRIPRMLIQLLVENAIKHGLRNKPNDKKILIKAETRSAKTTICVEDNGIGRNAAKEYSRIAGNGMKIMHDMIRLNRKMTGKEIRVTITDLYDEEGKARGTRVEVEI